MSNLKVRQSGSIHLASQQFKYDLDSDVCLVYDTGT